MPSTLTLLPGAKAWYRYGFLTHRHAALPQAAMAALKHAVLLRPDSGPAYAELGVVGAAPAST